MVIRYLLAASLILWITVSATSCRADDDYVTYYMSEEFKSYNVFPRHTYWVYENESTGAIDSVHLYRSDIYPPNKNQAISDRFANEGLTAGMSSSHYTDSTRGFAYLNYLSLGYPDDPANFSGYVYEEGRLDSPGADVVFTFFESNVNGSSINNGGNRLITYDSSFSSIEINGITYDDLRVFTHSTEFILPRQTKRMFFAKNVGIVRREMFDGQIWNLIRYYIPT